MHTDGWQRACARFVDAEGLDPGVLPLLDAFGGPARVEPTRAFAELEAGAAALLDLDARIARRLTEEVDGPQAAMFARRLRAVHARLGVLAAARPEARVLRVGLLQRAAEILDAPKPRALRIRALADFYYSHAALLQHGAGPPLEEAVAAARWREVGPGVAHARITGPSDFGPLHVNALRVRGGRLRVLDTQATAPGVSFAEVMRSRGATAGVSGGFFLYSESDIQPPAAQGDPVGLLVSDGEVVQPPAFRRAALVEDARGQRTIAPLGPEGLVVRWPGGEARVTARNTAAASGWTAFNRAFGLESPGGRRAGVAVVGRQVVASGQGSLPIPLSGFVLRAPVGVPLTGAEPGARVSFSLSAPVRDAPVRDAIAGGPMLLDPDGPERELPAEDFSGTAPPVTFSTDETYDQNLLPRMAAGLTADGALVFAAVDGRNFERAPGLTLAATARLMAALGCVRAMNLDGGSSKRMVVQGEVVDLPSTEVVSGGGPTPVRPVRTAVLFD
ncbi:MAG: phosphodiester glycosidase family protein [Alphaproteobacteria bacterium]|nr:phosphodiester glycosidase family protein [Alphaproteobacteria bacterium]